MSTGSCYFTWRLLVSLTWELLPRSEPLQNHNDGDIFCASNLFFLLVFLLTLPQTHTLLSWNLLLFTWSQEETGPIHLN